MDVNRDAKDSSRDANASGNVVSGDQHRAPGHPGPDAHPVQLPRQDRGPAALPQPQGRQHQHPVQGLLRQGEPITS